MFDGGMNRYIGAALWLEAHKQNPFRFRPADDATSLSRFGELTAAVILQILLPLLIILFTFSTFAGERENGTLRQILSLGVPRGKLLAGKALGVAVALLMLLVPSVIVGVTALWLANWNENSGFSAARLGLMMLAYLLYLSIFVGLGLAFSAYFRTARMALLALLGFWIINSMFMPRLAADFAQSFYPDKHYADFAKKISEDISQGVDGHNSADVRLEALKEEILKKYKVEKVEDLPVSFEGYALQAGEDYSNFVFDKSFNELWETYENQERIFDTSAVFSPLLAVRPVSMSLAGTDFAHYRYFAIQAETHRREFVKFLNMDMAQTAGKEGYDYKVKDPNFWDKVSEFRYQPPDLNWSLSHQIFSGILLMIWSFGAYALAWFAVKNLRIDV